MTIDYDAIEKQVAQDLQKPKSRRTQIALYADPAHLVYELLQNADDHGATEITFNLQSDRLIVEHNAKERFEDRHIRAITSFEESTSQGELLKTGKFGLGFKSVFALTATPRIFCGAVNFEIYDLFRLRRLETPSGLPLDATRLELPFNHLQTNPEFIFEDDIKSAEKAVEIIQEKFEALEDITLLFTRSLRSIRCFSNDARYSWKRTDNANGTVSIRSPNQTSHFRLSHRDITWKDAKHRPVQIAIRLDDEGLPVPSYENLVVTFPTSISTGMGIILNGPYRTTPARETVGEGDPFNEFLVEETAALLCEMILAERDAGRLSLKLLEILPLDSARSDSPEFFSSIHNSVRDLLVSEEVLPASSGGYVCGANARTARGQYVAELFSDAQLASIYESDDPLKWVTGELTETNTPRLHRALAGSGRNIYGYHTGATGLVPDFVVRPENIFSKMSKNFLESQEDSWIRSLYRTLNDAPHTARTSAESCPIIRLADGKHVGVKSNGMPSAYLPSTSVLSKYRMISEAVIEEEKALEYLESLGFREPDLTAEVIEDVLPKYKSDSLSISFTEHLNDLKKISEALKDQSIRLRVLAMLMNVTLIECMNCGTGATEFKKATEVYFRSDGLQNYFDGNDESWFVSANYEIDESYEGVVKPLFVQLGVRDGYPREEFENQSYAVHYHGWHERGLKGFHPQWTIDGLEYAVKNPTLGRSAYIWNVLVQKSANRISGNIQTSTRQEFPANSTQQSVQISIGGKLLREHAWIPDVSGNFVKADEIGGVDSLHDQLARDEELLAILDEGTSAKRKDAAEILEITLEMADFIRKYPGEIEKLRQLLESREENKRAIENSSSGNRERRRQKLHERKQEAPSKSSVMKLRSVSAPYRSEIDRHALFAFYHDDEEEVVFCQMCCDPMPFIRSNGEESAECVDLLSKRWADAINYDLKKLTALKLVLCPVCSEIYRDYVQNDVEKQNALVGHLLNGGDDDEFQVCDSSIRRDHKDTTLKFNQKHLGDIRDCLQHEDGDESDDD